MTGLRDGPVLLGSRVDIFMLQDALGIFPCNVQCFISAEGVYYKDFVSPQYAPDAFFDVTLLVKARDDGT
jgi:hypothetical protein